MKNYPIHTHALLICSRDEVNYIQRIKSSLLSSLKLSVFLGEIDTLYELERLADKAKATVVITTREDILKRLLPQGYEKKAKIDNYAGSIIPLNDDIECLIIDPLRQMFTVPYGSWILERYISKITKPNKWRKVSPFVMKVIESEDDYNEAYKRIREGFLCAVDIETVGNDRITCIGYTVGNWDSSSPTGYTSYSYVLELKDLDSVNKMRALNALQVPKVFQNGRYDIAYLHRYSAPPWGYYFDTANAMHAWMSELPKDLGFLTGLFVRNSMYWKDLAATNDKYEYFKYNALDTWGTFESMIAWLQEAPDWAKKNYVMKFPQVPVTHLCEMTGIKRDMDRLRLENKKSEDKMEAALTSLRKMTATPDFNPSSPQQVVRLLTALGIKPKSNNPRDKISSGEPQLQKYMLMHPLHERILGAILEYRGERKLASTYLTVGENAKELNGRIFYAISPIGTDTGRDSSKESHFWCGIQIQNIPTEIKGEGVKASLVADPGFELYEADFEQAEARGVAYSSGDAALLQAVNSGKDFHAHNASAFFGKPYESIYDDKTGKTLDKKLRDLAKRVNHGTNYNMGPGKLVETMGEKAVREAQILLGLPKAWTLLQIAEYLLQTYTLTYPRVKGAYYAKIIRDVTTTHKLVGATGWTRYCFGDPANRKPDLNSYVAHVTQSLNAMILDMAAVRVFNEIWRREYNNFKLLAKIHDSLLFQVRTGHEHLAQKVSELMTMPITVTDCIGVKREMIVPVGLKKLGHRWSGSA